MNTQSQRPAEGTGHRSDDRDPVEAIDRWCELSNIGAGHAAGALADMIAQPIRMRVPQVVRHDAKAAMPEGPAAGIFFRVLGGIGGDFAVFFSHESSRSLLSALMGRPIPLESADAASILSEIGNVLASHALSAVADSMGASVLPSIPDLDREDPNAAFEARVGTRAPRIENTLVDEDGRIFCVLVWIPES